MYCLILFYHELKVDLAGLNPLPKLLCIKGVVFFTFWYGMPILAFKPYALLRIGSVPQAIHDNCGVGALQAHQAHA